MASLITPTGCGCPFTCICFMCSIASVALFSFAPQSLAGTGTSALLLLRPPNSRPMANPSAQLHHQPKQLPDRHEDQQRTPPSHIAVLPCIESCYDSLHHVSEPSLITPAASRPLPAHPPGRLAQRHHHCS